jgi:hypothetical protein
MTRTGYLRGLIPGARYRMVISAQAGSISDIGLPSIEFVVPSAPDLLNSYTPIGRITSSKAKKVKDTLVTPGTGATTKNFRTTHWSVENDSRKYTFYINTSDKENYRFVDVGSIVRFGNAGTTGSGLSTYEDGHAYYDTYDYRVIEKKSTYFVAIAEASITSIDTSTTLATVKTDKKPNGSIAFFWCKGAAGHHRHQYAKVGNKPNQRPSSFEHRFDFDGRAIGRKNKSANNAVATVYIPGRDPDDNSRWLTQDELKDLFTHTIYAPSNLPLTRTESVIDIPFFAYRNVTLGGWYEMKGNTLFNPTNYPEQLSNDAMKDLLKGRVNDRDTRDGVPITASLVNVNGTVWDDNDINPGFWVDKTRHTRVYYFTVARYTKQTNGSWEGKWLQTINSEPTVSSPEEIIWSKAAVFG